jgi:hypothetical protein
MRAYGDEEVARLCGRETMLALITVLSLGIGMLPSRGEMMRRSTWISVVDADYRKGLIAAPDISVRSNRWICPARLTI